MADHDLLIETARDVKWICKTLKEIREENTLQNDRIETLATQQHKWLGRDGAIVAGISAAVSVVVGLLGVLVR